MIIVIIAVASDFKLNLKIGGKQTAEEDQQSGEEGRGSRAGGETQGRDAAAGLQRQRVQGRIYWESLVVGG